MVQRSLNGVRTAALAVAALTVSPLGTAGQAPDAPPEAGSAVVPATGSIRGVAGFAGSVAYAGPSVDNVVLDMTSDRYCSGQHDGGTAVSRPVEVDEESRVSDVVVFVSQGLSGSDHAVPEEAVVLDQEGCLYTPRALAMMAGQPLAVRNSDATLHNVHAFPEINRGFNIGQPIRGLESRRTFEQPEVGIEIKCDVHGWMETSVSVFDHPFFAVTGADGGFSIDGLPAGEYVIEAWHRTLGVRTQTVTVTEGAATDVSIVYEG